MKNMVIVGGMAINMALLAGIIYLNYFAPHPGASVAQGGASSSTGPVKRIAVITPSEDSLGMQDILRGLRTTLAREARFAPELKIYNSNNNRVLLHSNIEAAIAENYDILVPIGSEAAQVTKELTEKRERLIPTVFCSTGDPVRLELVKDPDCSGNHLTGVSVVGTAWIDQMVDLVPVMLPWVKTVFIPYDPTGLGGALESYKQQFDKALKRIGVKVIDVQVFATNEIGEKVTPFMGQADLMIVLPDHQMINGIDRLVKLGEQHQMPLYIAQNMTMLESGATFAFGYHLFDTGVGTARYISQIVEQHKLPTQIPVNRMESTYRIGMNLNSARRHGALEKMDPSVVFLLENGEVV